MENNMEAGIIIGNISGYVGILENKMESRMIDGV